MPTGIFNLSSPSDLVQKLKHDFDRICKSPEDPYAAFDFFVTAEHMIDWLYPDSRYPDSKSKREALRSSSPLLSLCSHIASGSKHFVAIAKHHNSFSTSYVHPGSFSDGFSSGFDIGGLVVVLEGDAKTAFGKQIYAHDLAKKVLDYWETKLKPPSASLP